MPRSCARCLVLCWGSMHIVYSELRSARPAPGAAEPSKACMPQQLATDTYPCCRHAAFAAHAVLSLLFPWRQSATYDLLLVNHTAGLNQSQLDLAESLAVPIALRLANNRQEGLPVADCSFPHGCTDIGTNGMTAVSHWQHDGHMTICKRLATVAACMPCVLGRCVTSELEHVLCIACQCRNPDRVSPSTLPAGLATPTAAGPASAAPPPTPPAPTSLPPTRRMACTHSLATCQRWWCPTTHCRCALAHRRHCPAWHAYWLAGKPTDRRSPGLAWPASGHACMYMHKCVACSHYRHDVLACRRRLLRTCEAVQ